MGDMFSNCKNLISLDLSSFDTSNVTAMSFIFYQCTKLKKIDMRNFTFDKVTSANVMFSGIPNDCLIIVKGEIEKQWITSKFSFLTNIKTIAELEG